MRKLLILIFLGAFMGNSQAQITINLNQQPCNADGIITANFPGLTPPIQVVWSIMGQPAVIHTGLATNSDVLTNYTGNAVYVLATDANNVSMDGGYFAPPFSVFPVSVTQAVCPALSTVTAAPVGGVAPYTFQWYDKATLAVISTSNPAPLPDGQYSVIITDANGCVYNSGYDYDSIYVYSQSPFSVNLATTPANCTNGSVSVASMPGTGVAPYTYLWSNGATTSSINGLSQGDYNLEVTDANGCNAFASAFVPQSLLIGTHVVTTPTTCMQTNGSVSVFGSGGQTPYTYSWSNGASTQTQTGISSGSYSVTVTDANGCTGDSAGYVTSITPVNVTQSTTPSSCTVADGTATLNISGGQAPYTVNWNTFPAQTGTTASNLAAGNYSFSVTDANGCARGGVVNVPPVDVINAYINANSPMCNMSTGSLSVSASGGALPYTYSWSNGGSGFTISGLSPGNYSVTVTDNNGCSVNKSKSLSSVSPISLSVSVTPSSCIFSSDGSMAATASGGTAPYSYSWSPGVTGSTVSGLKSDYYAVGVTDANGCTESKFQFLPYNPAGTSCYCTITGTVYNDVNANCVKDAGDTGIQNIQMYCSGMGYTYTDNDGVYSLKVPSGSHDVIESVQGFYPLAACQDHLVTVISVAATGCVQTVDFANVINPLHDIHVSTWNVNFPRPGFDLTLATIITNEGTVPESTIVASKQSDIQIASPVFVPSGMYTNGGPGWDNFGAGALSLNPGGSDVFLTTYGVPANVPLNTALIFKDSSVYSGPMSNWVNDYSPWNNVSLLTNFTIGSFDPNFKEVSPKGQGTTGDITYRDSVLEYMVHFQNVGTYQAQNVVVLDTLDSDLDWSTLHPVYQSHACKVTITESGIAKFSFENINLPAQMNDDLRSNGMLTYTIKTKHNLPLGTTFTNSAAIYFDFNAPVITNTTLNTLVAATSVAGTSPSKTGSFMIYPNPAGKTFYASVYGNAAGEQAAIQIMDLSGKVLIDRNLALQQGHQVIQVDVANLSSGVYFVSFSGNGKVQTQKLVLVN